MEPEPRRRSNSVYLDVSEFILKEHSPQYKPRQHDPHQVPQTTPKLTPDLTPIDTEPSGFKLSPFFGPGPSQAKQNPPELCLIQQDFQLEKPGVPSAKQNRRRRTRQRSNTFYLLDPPEAELDRIIEDVPRENEEDEYQYEASSSSEQNNPQTDHSTLKWEEHKYVQALPKDNEFQKQSTNHSLQQCVIPSITELYPYTAKNELVDKIKEIADEDASDLNYEQKIQQIKELLCRYLFDYELTAIQAIWRQFEGSAKSIVYQIVCTIENIFKRKIGLLSFEHRRIKLLRYLEKKKRRVWRKKVSYDCRKKVADGRLRIKGKFVTKQQVCSQLGIESLECLTSADLKALLSQKPEDGDSQDARESVEED